MRISRLMIATAIILSSILIVPHVSATANCALPVANRCHGESMVGTITGGVSSGRCFFWLTSNAAPPVCSTTGIGTTSNQAVWEADAGGCITLYYYDIANGAVPPAVPNKVSQKVYFDVLGTATITFLNQGAEPANGSSRSFCFTSDGIVGSSPRAGTYYPEVRATKDNGAGGVGNYDIFSNGVANVGAVSSYDGGGIRGKTIVAGVARSAYPADSTFAYGTAGDESITITATFTQPGADNNVETSHTGIFDAATLTVGQSGSVTDVDATTTQVQSFVADNTFPFANDPYVPTWTIDGVSGLLGESWTILASSGHGAGLTRVSNTLIYDGSFHIDSRIIFDSDGVGTFATADNTILAKVGSSSGTVATVYNKGETVYGQWYIFNARSENLIRPMTFGREDASTTSCHTTASLTPSGAGLYSSSAVLNTGATCTTTNDALGAPRYLRATNTDQNKLSSVIFSVSSLYFIDAHIQLSATLNKDNYPTENANEDTSYQISTAVTDTTHGWCHVVSVRKDLDVDTSGSVITWSYIDPTSTTRLTGTTDTGSDGWTATHLDLLASTPLGTWTFRCAISSGATFNGNYGTNDQTFMVIVPSGTGTGFPGDPLRLLCSPIIANPGETLVCVASENNNDGSIRTGNAAHTFFDLWDPTNTQIVTGAAATEVDTSGQYRYSRAWGGSPTLGSWIVVVRTDDTAVIASSTVVFVETDPTLALATTTQLSNTQTTITTAITNSQTTITGAITNSQTTVTNAIAGVSTQVSNVATQVNEIDVDADEILAAQANQATSASITALQTNNTDYHNHLNSHLHEFATDVDTIISDIASLSSMDAAQHQQILDALAGVNMTINSTVNQTVNNHLSFSPYLLLLAAIAFFAIAAETKKDLLYWIMSLVLSIVLIYVRPADSIVPVEFFVGWIFIILYQAITLFFNNRGAVTNPDDD